jgi:DNA-binding NarL/FixJ family response regulator
MKKPERIDSSPLKQMTVLLAEDNATFRKSLKLLIALDGKIQVVGEAKDGLEAVQLARILKPEVIVMDIAMPLLNGLQATQTILKAYPGIRVLMLSAHPDPEYIQQAMHFGASGYLIKQSSTEFLARAIREVLNGRTYFSASISRKLRDESQIVFEKHEAAKKKAA